MTQAGIKTFVVRVEAEARPEYFYLLVQSNNQKDAHEKASNHVKAMKGYNGWSVLPPQEARLL